MDCETFPKNKGPATAPVITFCLSITLSNKFVSRLSHEQLKPGIIEVFLPVRNLAKLGSSSVSPYLSFFYLLSYYFATALEVCNVTLINTNISDTSCCSRLIKVCTAFQAARNVCAVYEEALVVADAVESKRPNHRHSVILQYENARPHVAIITKVAVKEFG